MKVFCRGVLGCYTITWKKGVEKMQKGDTKTIIETHITCPGCNQKLVVKHIKILANQPVSPEWDEETKVERDAQKKLQ